MWGDLEGERVGRRWICVSISSDFFTLPTKAFMSWILGTHQSAHSRSRTPAPRPDPSFCLSPGHPDRSHSSRWGWSHRLGLSELSTWSNKYKKNSCQSTLIRKNGHGHPRWCCPVIKKHPASYACGCLSIVGGTEPSLSPSPPHPLPLPGGCGCSGSSGLAGSCSAFHRLKIKHHRSITGV